MAKPEPTEIERKTFAIAVASGKVTDVESYLDTYGNAEVNRLVSRELESIKRSALGWAAIYGHINMMKRLLARGADIDMQSNQLDTPLMIGVIYAQEEVVKFLLQQGASLEPRDKLNMTALDYAQQNKYATIVSILKQADKERGAAQLESGTSRPLPQPSRPRLKKPRL